MHITYLCQEHRQYSQYGGDWNTLVEIKKCKVGCNEARDMAHAWWKENKSKGKRVVAYYDPVPPDKVICEWKEKE